MKPIPPCPKCGAGFPVVQRIRDAGKWLLCCTRCGITGREKPVVKLADRLRAIACLQHPGRRQIEPRVYGYGPIGDAEQARRRAKEYNRRVSLEKKAKAAT